MGMDCNSAIKLSTPQASGLRLDGLGKLGPDRPGIDTGGLVAEMSSEQFLVVSQTDSHSVVPKSYNLYGRRN